MSRQTEQDVKRFKTEPAPEPPKPPKTSKEPPKSQPVKFKDVWSFTVPHSTLTTAWNENLQKWSAGTSEDRNYLYFLDMLITAREDFRGFSKEMLYLKGAAGTIDHNLHQYLSAVFGIQPSGIMLRQADKQKFYEFLAALDSRGETIFFEIFRLGLALSFSLITQVLVKDASESGVLEQTSFLSGLMRKRNAQHKTCLQVMSEFRKLQFDEIKQFVWIPPFAQQELLLQVKELFDKKHLSMKPDEVIPQVPMEPELSLQDQHASVYYVQNIERADILLSDFLCFEDQFHMREKMSSKEFENAQRRLKVTEINIKDHEDRIAQWQVGDNWSNWSELKTALSSLRQKQMEQKEIFEKIKEEWLNYTYDECSFSFEFQTFWSAQSSCLPFTVFFSDKGLELKNVIQSRAKRLLFTARKDTLDNTETLLSLITIKEPTLEEITDMVSESMQWLRKLENVWDLNGWQKKDQKTYIQRRFRIIRLSSDADVRDFEHFARLPTTSAKLGDWCVISRKYSLVNFLFEKTKNLSLPTLEYMRNPKLMQFSKDPGTSFLELLESLHNETEPASKEEMRKQLLLFSSQTETKLGTLQSPLGHYLKVFLTQSRNDNSWQLYCTTINQVYQKTLKKIRSVSPGRLPLSLLDQKNPKYYAATCFALFAPWLVFHYGEMKVSKVSPPFEHLVIPFVQHLTKFIWSSTRMKSSYTSECHLVLLFLACRVFINLKFELLRFPPLFADAWNIAIEELETKTENVTGRMSFRVVSMSAITMLFNGFPCTTITPNISFDIDSFWSRLFTDGQLDVCIPSRQGYADSLRMICQDPIRLPLVRQFVRHVSLSERDIFLFIIHEINDFAPKKKLKTVLNFDWVVLFSPVDYLIKSLLAWIQEQQKQVPFQLDMERCFFGTADGKYKALFHYCTFEEGQKLLKIWKGLTYTSKVLDGEVIYDWVCKCIEEESKKGVPDHAVVSQFMKWFKETNTNFYITSSTHELKQFDERYKDLNESMLKFLQKQKIERHETYMQGDKSGRVRVERSNQAGETNKLDLFSCIFDPFLSLKNGLRRFLSGF